MRETITAQLEQAFHKATLSDVRKALTSERDVAEFETISAQANEKQDAVIRNFHETYDARIDAACQRLYDKAAQSHFDHPAPSGASGIDVGAITRQAYREVQLAHGVDLQNLRNEAQQAFEELLEGSHQRRQVRGMSKDAFTRASDRRFGEDRRVARRSRD